MQPVLCVLAQHPSEKQDPCGKDCAGFLQERWVLLLSYMNYWLPDTEMFCLCSVLPLHDFTTIKEIITMRVLANNKKMGFNGKFVLFKTLPSLQKPVQGLALT